MSRINRERVDSLVFDVVGDLALRTSCDEILGKYGVGRTEFLAVLDTAVKEGLISWTATNPRGLAEMLQSQFGKVIEFCVIGSSRLFDDFAAVQTLKWIREIVDKTPGNPEVVLAVGGGDAICGLTARVPSAIGREDDLAAWFRSNQSRLQFVNATAGGHPLRPQSEAAHLATNLAGALGCSNVGVFSLSPILSSKEHSLIMKAVTAPAIVVSGVGARGGDQSQGGEPAYCLSAMLERNFLTPETIKALRGEFLYHPIDGEGHVLWDNLDPSPDTGLCEIGPGKKERARLSQSRAMFDVKERTIHSKGRRDAVAPAPMFATLFDYHGLKGCPGHAYDPKSGSHCGAERHVIGVVKDTDENRSRKAEILATLLRQRVLSRVVLSSDLAKEMIAASPAPRLGVEELPARREKPVQPRGKGK